MYCKEIKGSKYPPPDCCAPTPQSPLYPSPVPEKQVRMTRLKMLFYPGLKKASA